MELPKFLVGDNTDSPETVYIIHTEYPRFVMNLDNDEIEWFDNIEAENEDDAADEIAKLIDEADKFYHREVQRYEEMEDE